MEHCYKAAVCLVLFMAYLHAAPIDLEELYLDLVAANVSCPHNMTFAAPPSYVKEECFAAAFTTITEQLKRAKENCNDTNNRVDNTLDSLRHFSSQYTQSTNSSDCKWESPKYRKPLQEFVEKIKRFIQLVNTMQGMLNY